MGKLSTMKVKSIVDPGLHGDGYGLHLNVSRTGTKSSILRVVVQDRRRDIGLGFTKLVTLAEARVEAAGMRRIARAGDDPTSRPALRPAVPIFDEAALQVHGNLRPTWRNAKHAFVWLASLKSHV